VYTTVYDILRPLWIRRATAVEEDGETCRSNALPYILICLTLITQVCTGFCGWAVCLYSFSFVFAWRACVEIQRYDMIRIFVRAHTHTHAHTEQTQRTYSYVVIDLDMPECINRAHAGVGGAWINDQHQRRWHYAQRLEPVLVESVITLIECHGFGWISICRRLRH